MNSASNNKRIAKNTIYLYIRTIIVLLTMLYISRLVLNALGANDLGIYNIVGGVVALMSFFQTSLTKATSRFITFELGLNSSNEKLKRVFSLAMTIHLLLVVLILFLGETIGLYILEHWTNIPLDRQSAAFWVFQFSLLTFCIQIIRVPYDSILIAHENMSVYAYISIVEAGLQLLGVTYVLSFEGDKLVMYGGVLCIVSCILCLVYYIYVRISYKQYRFNLAWDKDYSKKILSFSGWNLFGSSANVATQQGVSLLFNNFVGLIANTALGFANQVNGAVMRFVSNFTTAFNPQIIKLLAQKDYGQLHLLMNRASKFSFALMWVMTLPLLANMKFVLHLWLGDVPPYTTEFCQMILICSVIDAVTGVYYTAITATGKIRNYQLAISISFLLDLLFAFLLLNWGINPAFVFGSRILTRGILNMFISWHYINKQIHFNILRHCKVVMLPILFTFILTTPCIHYIVQSYSEWNALILSTLCNIILMICCTFAIIMNKFERDSVLQIIRKFL